MRAAHINALIAAANELDDEGREASEARVVDSIEAVRQLNVLKKEVPDLGIEFTAFYQEETQNVSLFPKPSNICRANDVAISPVGGRRHDHG